MATSLKSGKRRETSDAEFIAAIRRSDSLELIPRKELLGLFLDLVDDQPATDDERWTLAKGGEL